MFSLDHVPSALAADVKLTPVCIGDEDASLVVGKEILLPSDIVIADAFSPDAKTQIVVADGWVGLDNGPDTTAEQKVSRKRA